MRLIDADALLDIYERNRITDKITVDGKTIIQHLKDAPTVKFHLNTVVHTRWILTSYPDCFRVRFDGWMHCPNCAGAFRMIVGTQLFKHCPNCGAKMDGDPHDST